MVIVLPKIFPVACHTDNVGLGTVFVAICGQKYDGLLYIPQAVAKGASCVVVQNDAVISDDMLSLLRTHGVSLVRVENARKSLAELSAKAAGYPAEKLKIIGITGSKGKTTSVYVLEALLKRLGKKVARLSTVANAIDGQEFHAVLTTGQPDYLHQFFAVCVAQGVEYVAMEVAAQATTFNRIDDIAFDGLIFTNLEREHAELYPTMEEYFAAKCAIIDKLKPGAMCVVNGDDLYGQQVLGLYPSKTQSFTLDDMSELQDQSQTVTRVKHDNNQVVFTSANATFTLPISGLVGEFNVRNLAGAVMVLVANGCDSTVLSNDIFTIPKVPGRLEEYALSNGARAYIDYAHTPASFESLLSVMRGLTDDLIVVFGAGGNKDTIKRPLMGKVAYKYADFVVITNDNPRQEDPEKIVRDIIAGIENPEKSKVVVELDRTKAIEIAYNYSKKGSIIMLLGKGVDEYQIVGLEKSFFSEKQVLQSLNN